MKILQLLIIAQAHMYIYGMPFIGLSWLNAQSMLSINPVLP